MRLLNIIILYDIFICKLSSLSQLFCSKNEVGSCFAPGTTFHLFQFSREKKRFWRKKLRKGRGQRSLKLCESLTISYINPFSNELRKNRNVFSLLFADGSLKSRSKRSWEQTFRFGNEFTFWGIIKICRKINMRIKAYFTDIFYDSHAKK